MKKFIKITVLLLIINSTFIIQYSTSQWVQQTINTTSPLRRIEFINRYTGWVCGGGIFWSGVIFKTTNGGVNWIEQTQPATNKDLMDIQSIDSNIVYCVGSEKTLLKTINGGVNWIALQNGTSTQDPDYRAAYFINEKTGWISGTTQYIYKTTDGGNSFDSSFLFWGRLNDIYFKDSLNGIMVGNYAGVFKTTDGGINWYRIDLYIPGGQPDLRRVTFINNFTGWVAFGEQGIYKTTNFGTTWDSISYIPEVVSVFGIKFSSESTGWMNCEILENSNWVYYLHKSTDGGLTWRRENLPSQIIYDISSYNDSIVWTAANLGRIWHTTTGGQVSINNINHKIPNDFILHQNYPNPFNSQTTIEFDIKKKGDYSLIIYDCLGRKRDEVFNQYLNAGSYSVSFNGDELQSGVYFYRLYADGKAVETRKMALVK